jgi:2-polyprenyl-3-methyl-5-hydroxy-6-metoxy-1,4-benzoquinol methylase
MDQILELNYSKHLPESKSARILDFGCGTGRVLNYLSQKGYTNFLGVDMDKSALNGVPAHLQKNTQHINSLEEFLSNCGTFDLIIAKDVIYYFPRHDLVNHCRRIFEKLNSNGTAIVEVFNGAQLSSSFTAFKDIGIQTILTESSLKQTLESSQLEVLEIFEQERPIDSIKGCIYWLLQKIWTMALKIVFILERGLDPNNPKYFGKSIIAIARKRRSS